MSTWRWPFRLKLAEETRAPFGIGSFKPGVILLVGEQASDTTNPDSLPEQRPFCSDKGCSGWLNKQLETANVPEEELFWVNALYNDNSVVDFKSLVEKLQPRQVIALGAVAKKHLTTQGINHLHAPHPQYWKRFKSKLSYPLIDILKLEVPHEQNHSCASSNI